MREEWKRSKTDEVAVPDEGYEDRELGGDLENEMGSVGIIEDPNEFADTVVEDPVDRDVPVATQSSDPSPPVAGVTFVRDVSGALRSV